MAKRGRAIVQIDAAELDGKLGKLDADFNERMKAFTDRIRADRARVEFNDQVRKALVAEHDRIHKAARKVGKLDVDAACTDSRGRLDLTASGRESVLGGNVRSIAELREAVGLDFPMAERKTDVDPNSVQYEKYLLRAIGSAPDESAGETYFPTWPDELAELIGRGGISKQELPFVIGGIDASRRTGVYEIAIKHVDGFSNVDELIAGKGIERTYSSSAVRHAEKMVRMANEGVEPK